MRGPGRNFEPNETVRKLNPQVFGPGGALGGVVAGAAKPAQPPTLGGADAQQQGGAGGVGASSTPIQTDMFGGWAEINGGRYYFRSSWELKYALYLETLRKGGVVKNWEYEATTFWFPVSKGTTNYTPDFKVEWSDGKTEYHEVKGWMDKRSKTCLNRMRIHHKNVIMIVKDGQWFRANKAMLATLK